MTQIYQLPRRLWWWQRLTKADALTLLAYAGLMVYLIPQWLHLLERPDLSQGLSPLSLGILTASMITMQISFGLQRLRWPLQAGNALSLANVLITDAIRFWVVAC